MMDADTQIEQASTLHAIAVYINEELNRSGPEDWETGILVMQPAKAEDDEVDSWLTLVWNVNGETGRLSLDFDVLDLLTAHRTATLVGADKRWATCLIEFHRSGKLRTRFEYEDANRWWRTGDESSEEFVTRMRPKFDIPS